MKAQKDVEGEHDNYKEDMALETEKSAVTENYQLEGYA
jgi:hypothetical protein